MFKIDLLKYSKEETNQINKALTYLKTDSEKEITKNIINHLIKKNLDSETIISAIMLILLKNKKMNFEEIQKIFGENVTRINKECILIEKIIKSNYKKIKPEILSSLIISIATDLRTIIIKMTEYTFLLKFNKNTPNHILKTSKEIFIPLSTKLGLGDISWMLADYIFKIENEKGYEKIKKLVNKTRKEREILIEEVRNEIENELKNKIDVTVFGRPKNFSSIYEKMKKIPFKQMHDIYGIRIICNKDKDCYESLGIINSKYNFIKHAFDDYISKEGEGTGKEGYQSLHTAIRRGEDIIEIQIRTWKHHLKTESSIYWDYKRLRKNKEIDKTLSWERQLLEWQKSIGQDNKKNKMINNQIFIFTPKNEIIILPKGATIIDFAFAVHSEIGKHIKKATINGNLQPLETKLNNLDKVEIIIDKKTKPKADWINNVISEKAKAKLRKYLGLKIKKIIENKKILKDEKKIKLAECCHPLPGEDVIGIKTTKRKIIVHKIDCQNIKKISKEKQIKISFEKENAKTKIEITAVDRIGLLAEILEEFKKKKTNIIKSDFEIKKSGFVKATFEIEIKNVKKLDNLINKIELIPSIQNVERK